MAIVAKNVQPGTTGLKHSLRFRDLLLYGIVLIQPTAPMPSFGVIYQEARGHVVTAILLAMVAMLFTSVSYGRMARVYPQGGSAFLYVGKEIHPSLGYLTGWQWAPILVSLCGLVTCGLLWWNLGPLAKTVGTGWALIGILLWIGRRRSTLLPEIA